MNSYTMKQKIFLILILLSFSACTNHELLGKKDLESGSAEWINNVNNNNCDTYKNNLGVEMHMRNAYGVTTYYNEMEYNCKKMLLHTKCETYDLQGMALYYVQDLSIKYTLQRNKTKTADWDNLNINIRENDKQIDVNKILYTSDASLLMSESFVFFDSIDFVNKRFYDVYYTKTGSDSSQVFFNKTRGVVAFQMANWAPLWIQQ
jgi:hypothetical protein